MTFVKRIMTSFQLTVGDFEAGGAGTIDFWKLPLNGGDEIQFSVSSPNAPQYAFELFPPGTNDTNVPARSPLATQWTNGNGKTVFDLRAPHSGTYVLAVCEGPNVINFYCSAVYNG